MFDGLDTTVTALFVSADTWPVFAERVQPYLVRMAAGSGGRYLAADVQNEILLGRWQLWLALDGAEIVCVMLTQIMDYPRMRALRCIGIVGHRPRRWMHLLADVERAAKVNFGCKMMEALHQVGHDRLLRTAGWRVFHVLSEKML